MNFEKTLGCILLVHCILLVCFGTVSSATERPEVVIGKSVIRGQSRTYDGKVYWSFRGIRFGQAPVGENRFKKPIAADLPPLTIADHYGNSCIPLTHGPPGPGNNEDCLFLNIFSPPVVQGAKLKPVILFIHGGGNIIGTPVGQDGTTLVVNFDVITVTINYRLGPLGFLSTGDSAAVGNAALWDQNMAIKWTSQNIRYFGGDPNLITLLGESAGAKAVSVHTVSHYSRDMIRRAVSLSGTVFGPSFFAFAPHEAAKVLGYRMRCPTKNTTAMVECLRKGDALKLTHMGGNLWPHDDMRTILDFWWGGVRDNDFIPSNIPKGTFKGEVFLSDVNNEGSLYCSFKSPMIMANDPGFLKKVMEPEVFKSQYINMTLYQYFKHHYPTEKMINDTYDTYVGKSHTGPVKLEMLMNLYGDQSYVYPSMKYLDLLINKGDSYYYYFDRKMKMYQNKPPYLQGSHHADDLPYILGTYMNKYNYTKAQRVIEDKVAQGMQTYVTNFAKTGDPNKPVTPPIPFPKYHDPKTPRSFLRVTGNTKQSTPYSLFANTGSNLLPHRMDLWRIDLQ